jgi:CBS domain-containing protein
MFIRNAITDLIKLSVVSENDSVEAVLAGMQGHLSLPCLTVDGTFLGMVSKRTIFERFQVVLEEGTTYPEFLKQQIQPCVDTSVPTLTRDSFFEDTLSIITRYPFVPIVENNELIGIVKRSDVNQALSIAFATNVPTQRILVGMAEVEGALQRLFSITHRLGVNVVTAVPFDARRDALNRRVILKVSPTPKFDELCDDLQRAGYMLLDVKR